jgi:glycosyltransferase involved in cell wall biosynthesis/4-amino-4-deoxy-L-arabinose transferase-like glycosyltransferase
MTPLRIIMLSYERGFLDPRSEASARLMKLASGDVRISAIVLSRADKSVGEDGGMVRTIPLMGSAPVRFLNALHAAIGEVRRAKKAGERVVISAQDPFIAGKIAFLVSRFMGVPYEIQEHADYFSGAWEREFPVIHECMAGIGKFILRRADGVRAVSERIRDRLARVGVATDRISVIPVAQDVTPLLSRTAAAWPDVPTIVAPCRFVKQKGLDVLLKSLAILAKENVPFRVRLIGEGKEGPKIAELAAKLGIRDRIEFEEWSSPEKIWSEADLFVLSSNYEGWGRTIVEAMAAGVPVVTTDVGCVGSFFRPQVDGRVVQPGDVKNLASAIREQLSEKERREWMAKSARERAKEFPSADELVKQQRDAWLAASSRQTTNGNRRAWMITAAIIAFAAFIHGLSVVLFGHSLATNREWGFYTLVQHWFQGFGYSFAADAGCVSAYRSPGFLFFLTAVYGIFGMDSFLAQAIIQNAAAVLLAYLVYRLGWRVTNDRRVGWIAAIIVTLHPYTFYHYTQYYHTALSGVFLVGLMLALLALEREKKWKWAWIAGIMTACLAYIQGTILPAMPFLSLWLLWRWRKEWKKAILAIVIIAATSIVLIAPWTYRNWKAFHTFVPLTTDLGHALFKANNEVIYALTVRGYPQEVVDDVTVSSTKPGYEQYRLTADVAQVLAASGDLRPSIYWTEWHPKPPTGQGGTCEALGPLSEPEFNAYWTGKAKEWLGANWSTEGWKLQALKVSQFWSPSLTPGIKYGAPWSFGNTRIIATLVRLSLTLFVAVMELLAVVGVIIAARRKRLGLFVPLLVAFAVYTFMHSFFAGYTKYRIPLDNLLAIIAAYPLVAAWDAWPCTAWYMAWRKRRNHKNT